MKRTLILLAIAITCTGCTLKYSFSGASISPDVKTATVVYIQNMATMVSPTLTNEINDALNQKIQKETRLQIVREGGDVVFEGIILDYRSDPIAFSAEERSVKNRLTVAVRMKFTNNKEPKNSYEERTFSAYADYDSSQMLNSIEGSLIPEIVEKIVQDIFNQAFSNW